MFTPFLEVLNVMWGAWCMINPWLVHFGHALVEVICSDRRDMDACMAFFFGALETLALRGDILHANHMGVGWLLEMMP